MCMYSYIIDWRILHITFSKNGASNQIITPRARKEAEQSSWKDKKVAYVSNISSTYAYLQRLELKFS